MSFNEANTVEAFVRDRLCGGITHHTAVGAGLARRQGQLAGLGWHFLAPQNLPRQLHEALVEGHLREALVRLNPDIAVQPERSDDVLYKLRAILMGVRSDGLIKANEEFACWLTGERSMPFGPNGEHVTIHLIDFADVERNQYVVTTQYTYRAGATEKRADLVLLVNGIPLVVIEAKTPVRSSQSWVDAAFQLHDDYERNVPELFVPNVLSVATEGKELRYGSIGLPVELWGRGALRPTPRCQPSNRSRLRSPRCCGRRSCSTCSRTSRPTRPMPRSAASRSSPATSSTRGRTSSSSAWWPGSRRRA
jgi:type I restriction enzyme, R subunit